MRFYLNPKENTKKTILKFDSNKENNNSKFFSKPNNLNTFSKITFENKVQIFFCKKNKFIINTIFDHNGASKFLKEKNEALKFIEFNNKKDKIQTKKSKSEVKIIKLNKKEIKKAVIY